MISNQKYLKIVQSLDALWECQLNFYFSFDFNTLLFHVIAVHWRPQTFLDFVASCNQIGEIKSVIKFHANMLSTITMNSVVFQQDGAPPHFCRPERDQTYPGMWISRRGSLKGLLVHRSWPLSIFSIRAISNRIFSYTTWDNMGT